MPSTRHETKVLSSWKEIAAYLGKGVRTVQRWEQEFGLPVSRPKKANRGVVLSSTDKLDKWLVIMWTQRLNQKQSPRHAGSPNSVASAIRDFRRLRQANRELTYDLLQTMQTLRDEYEALVRAVSRSSEAKSGPRR